MTEPTTNTFRDRSNWADGPWDDEPDRAIWVDPATGLDCLIVRNHLGNLCGYVAVGPDHPLFEVYADEGQVDVHGGISYAAHCDNDPVEGVCHLTHDDDPAWWLGFDTAHSWDLSPYQAKNHPDLTFDTTYKNMAYVTAEVERLAEQLGAMR